MRHAAGCDRRIAGISRRWLGLALLVVAGGCNSLLGIDPVTERDDAATVEVPAFCTSPELIDLFDGPTVCPWGALSQTGAVLEPRGGVLEARFTGTMAAFAGCSAFAPLELGERGAFIHIAKSLEVASSYMVFAMRSPEGVTPAFEARLARSTTAFELSLNGAAVQTGALGAATWWRLRRVVGRQAIAAELSSDGVDWQLLATADTPLPATMAIDFGAGINAPTTPDVARFDAIGACR